MPAKSIVQKGKVVATGPRPHAAECSALAKAKPAKVVYGPGTFTNTAVERISQGFGSRARQERAKAEQAADAARKAAAAQGYSKAQQNKLAAAARKLVVRAVPGPGAAARAALRAHERCRRSTTRSSSSQLWFDPSKGVNVPKARFAYLFPSPNAALDAGAAQAGPRATRSGATRSG